MEDTTAQFKYDGNALCITSQLQTLRIRWAGIPEASERTTSGRWRECWPEIRLLKPSGGKDIQANDEKARAFEAFRGNIPPEIVLVVEPFPSHQWNLMVLLRYSKEARDLAVSTPVLAYALANNHEICGTSSRQALPNAGPYVRRKQKEICVNLRRSHNSNLFAAWSSSTTK
jgi:hypothetical protein